MAIERSDQVKQADDFRVVELLESTYILLVQLRKQNFMIHKW
jgi:hypothetical protein